MGTKGKDLNVLSQALDLKEGSSYDSPHNATGYGNVGIEKGPGPIVPCHMVPESALSGKGL